MVKNIDVTSADRQEERFDEHLAACDFPPTFATGDLAWMADDIQTKYDFLAGNRGRIR